MKSGIKWPIVGTLCGNFDFRDTNDEFLLIIMTQRAPLTCPNVDNEGCNSFFTLPFLPYQKQRDVKTRLVFHAFFFEVK